MTYERHSPQSDHQPPFPLAAWFLGPRAENANLWQELFDYIFQDYVHWRRNYFPTDPVVVDRVQRRSAEHAAWLDHLTSNLDAILNQLKQHFPFHSPRYIGHMLSEQTLPSVLGYFTGMLFNPNNVTAEAAPITVELELEVGRMIAGMLGFNPNRAWAHLTSGGTIANLEALWVARAVQFTPLMVQEYCALHAIPFRIRRPNGEAAHISDLTPRELLALRPNEAIFMWRKLAQYLHEEHQWPVNLVLDAINFHINHSEYNPAQVGIARVLHRIGLEPVIFVSTAAHYSIVKAANLLGYGRQSVVSVPVNERFHVDMARLRKLVEELPAHQFIAAVVGIAGQPKKAPSTRSIRFTFCARNWNARTTAPSGCMSMRPGVATSGASSVASISSNCRGSNLDAICDQYVRVAGRGTIHRGSRRTSQDQEGAPRAMGRSRYLCCLPGHGGRRLDHG
ncbi:MAG: hypothetical protein IPK16_11540 [Anaerolineales bacterium]|nr:hypothetical protein [Anaerolineales bacterium]